MKSSFIVAAPVALSLALGAGCSSDPLTRIESQYEGTVSAVCASCPEITGTLTAAECQARADMSNPFSGTEFECQREVYARYPAELGPYYNCQANAVASYDSCIRGILNPCPPTAEQTSACNEGLNAAIRACPLPTSIAAGTALGACFAP